MIYPFSHEYMRPLGEMTEVPRNFKLIFMWYHIGAVASYLISPASRLFVQHLVKANTKENMKVTCNTSPLWWESTGDRHVFFFTKCQWRDIWYTNVTQSGITFCFCSVWTIYFPNNCWLIFSNDNQFTFFATGNTPCNKSQLAHRSLVDG